MIGNYYTIRAVIEELHRRTSGGTALTPFTQTKDELVMPFVHADGTGQSVAVISCSPAANFIVIKDSFARARRNSTDIFSTLDGRTIERVAIHPSDRQCIVGFSGHMTVLFRFFGSRSNAYLIGPGPDSVLSFLSDQPGDSVQEGLPFPDPVPLRDENIVTGLTTDPRSTVALSLRKSIPTLGPILVREVLFRAGIDEDAVCADASDSDLGAIARGARNLVGDLTLSPAPRIYYRAEDPPVFSLVPLRHLSDTREELQDSLSGGILRTLHGRKRGSKTSGRRTAMISMMRSEVERQTRTVKKLDEELARSADPGALEHAGRLLQANIHAVEKGMTEIELDDFLATEGSRQTVALDPHLTGAKNAERYFDLARKGKRKREEQLTRRNEIASWLSSAVPVIAEASELTSDDDLSEFADRHRSVFAGLSSFLHTEDKTPEKEPFHFRRYIVQGGFEVWVGKNAQNNDLLSTRHTAKNDLWFHARGSGGSHVVLKRGTAAGEPSRGAIAQAAAIAAFYSKMKKASHVAVSMCEGKFVRKPRGANPGTVTIEREDVLFVDPGLPVQQKD